VRGNWYLSSREEKIGSLFVSLDQSARFSWLEAEPSFRKGSIRYCRITGLDYALPRLLRSEIGRGGGEGPFSLLDVSYVAESPRDFLKRRAAPLRRAAISARKKTRPFARGEEEKAEASFLISASGFSSPDEAQRRGLTRRLTQHYRLEARY